jgi:Mn2+/Fe2+ NRAMP family transporter
MGDWSYFLIAASSFTIMFGTLIAVLDGYSRSLERTWTLLNHSTKKATSQKKAFNVSLVILTSISFIIMYLFVYSPNSSPKGFKNLVDFATSASFIFAPVIAIVNFKLVSNKQFPKKHQPKVFLKIVSYLGIIYLIAFSLIKLYYILSND